MQVRTFAPTFQRRPTYLPCVFCGDRVETMRGGGAPAPDAFAVCRADDARLDAALAALTADVLSLLDRREAIPRPPPTDRSGTRGASVWR